MAELEIKIIWEDEHMIEVSVRACNDRYSGYTEFYTSREHLIEIAREITGYPKNLSHTVSFGTGEDKSNSYFNCNLIPAYPTAHFKARIELSEIYKQPEYTNRDSVYLEFPIEAASIDSFVVQLKQMASAPVGADAAVMSG